MTHYDELYDWDSHAFHFVDGMPKNADASAVMLTPKEQDKYLRELAAPVPKSCAAVALANVFRRRHAGDIQRESDRGKRTVKSTGWMRFHNHHFAR